MVCARIDGALSLGRQCRPQTRTALPWGELQSQQPIHLEQPSWLGPGFGRDWLSQGAVRGLRLSLRYVIRKLINLNMLMAHVKQSITSCSKCMHWFLTDRHWTVVRNLKLRRALLKVQTEGKQHSSTVLGTIIRFRLMCIHSVLQHEGVASLSNDYFQPKNNHQKKELLLSNLSRQWYV